MELKGTISTNLKVDLPSSELSKEYTEVRATLTIKGSKSDMLSILALIDKHIYGY